MDNPFRTADCPMVEPAARQLCVPAQVGQQRRCLVRVPCQSEHQYRARLVAERPRHHRLCPAGTHRSCGSLLPHHKAQGKAEEGGTRSQGQGPSGGNAADEDALLHQHFTRDAFAADADNQPPHGDDSAKQRPVDAPSAELPRPQREAASPSGEPANRLQACRTRSVQTERKAGETAENHQGELVFLRVSGEEERHQVQAGIRYRRN